jgi:protein O-mannosyl-transferase
MALDAGWIPLALGLVTFAVFSPVLRNDFVNWDDYILFVNNPAFRGLGWPQIRWMFTTILMGHWVPLTWLTHGLDYVLWGMNPHGYHLTSLVLHVANAGLFYLVAVRVIGKATTWSPGLTRVSGVVAALVFSVHPLRVESVAWVTERRDVLSGLFFLLAVLSYLRAVETDSPRRRWLLGASLGCYVLGLTAKSMVMTLAAVLVILDVYPLRRLDLRPAAWRSEAFGRIIREKFPYFVVAAVGAIVAYYAQAANLFITPLRTMPLVERPAIALFGLWFYFSRTVVPIGLSPLYQMPATIHPLAPAFLLPAIGVLVLTTVVVVLRRRWPAGLAAWLYYVIVVSPVIGIVHSGYQLAHDRYSYLPCMSWAILAGGAVGALIQECERRALRRALAWTAGATVIVWLASLGTLTWWQSQVWRNPDTLWRFAIELEPECGLCQNNLGVSLLRDGEYALARAVLERAAAVPAAPGMSFQEDARKNLAVAQGKMGDYEAAIQTLRTVLRESPADAQSHSNLGVALMRLGRYPEAFWHLELAVKLEPENVEMLKDAGIAGFMNGDHGRSAGYLRRAVTLRGDDAAARYTLGLVCLELGQVDAAREQYETLRKLDARLASILGPGLLTEW